MQKYKCKHFRRDIARIWLNTERESAWAGRWAWCTARQFYCISQQKSVPQMCHLHWVRLSVRSPFVCVCVCNLSFLLGHMHTHTIDARMCVYKPLENCIFVSIVYLLRHLFAFDFRCGSCSSHNIVVSCSDYKCIYISPIINNTFTLLKHC